MSNSGRRPNCSVRMLTEEESTQDVNCPACNRPDVADRMMVQCDSCDSWYHFTCVGVDESVKDRSFRCGRCSRRSSRASSRTGRSSSTAGIRELVELELRRIEEEKQVQDLLIREVEEHEQSLRERAIQQELELKRKANQEKWQREREYISKKYNILQSATEVGDSVSRKSLRSNPSTSSTVRRWLETQINTAAVEVTTSVITPVTTASYTGTIPKRTSAQDSVTSSKLVTSALTANVTEQAHVVASSDENSLYSIAIGGVTSPECRQSIEVTEQPVAVSVPAYHPDHLTTEDDVISPPTTKQSALSKVYSRISTAALMSQSNLEQQVRDLQRQLEILQTTHSHRTQPSHIPQSSNACDTSIHGRVSCEGRSKQPVVTFSTSKAGPPRFGDPLFNSTPATISYTPSVTNGIFLGTSHPSVSTSVPLAMNHSSATSIPSYPNPISSPWVAPSFPPVDRVCSPTAQQLAARHVVPKDLPQFDGNPLDWPLFFSSYSNSTQMCGYTDAENLMRLQRCLKGNAFSAVSYQLLHPSSIPQILDTLRTLYGRPELVVNSLLNKVRSTPAPRADKLESIISFGLLVQNLCGHLRSMGMNNHLSNPTLMQEMVSKLPASVKLNWALYQHQMPTVDLGTFGDFMSTIVSATSNVTFSSDFDTKQDKPKGKGFLNTHDDGEVANRQLDGQRESNIMGRAPNQVKSCPVCEKLGHKVKECYVFQKYNVDERWKLVQQLQLCRRCLTAHGKWPCKAPVCGLDGCELKHHKLLHSNKQESASTSESSSVVTATINVHRQMPRSTLFRIIPVRLYGKDSRVDVLAFLDDGSSYTLVEQTVADQLGINGKVEPLCLQWTNNVTRTESDSKVVKLGISGIDGSKQHTLEDVRTVKSLCLPPQSLRYDELAQQFPYLRGLPVTSYSGELPRILIGLDNTSLMVSLKMRMGKPKEPVATKTKLGWTVYGNVEGLEDPPEHRLLHVCAGPSEQDLHNLVEEFFSNECTGVKVAPLVEAVDDIRAREIMEKTRIRTETGRFETGLLWKYDHIEFPESRPMAERRLKCLERKLTADPTLHEKVRKHISDLEAKGYIRKATTVEMQCFDPRRTWFLPLGLVVNPNKPDKIRMVWDAAAKVDGVSLNSMLLKGPDLLTSLQSVLHRFRQRQVAVVGDIREMFFQLLICPQDQQSQCFVWHDDPLQPVDVYVINVATFGSTCSPCSAQYIKNRNAEEWRSEFPEAVDAIIYNHYVDDYLDSRDTEEEAIRIATEVKEVHAKAGFELRNWLPNSEEVVQRVGESSVSSSKNFATDKTTGIERVLGMQWIPSTDSFTFTLCLRDDIVHLLNGNKVPTKREILRVVMSIFDPLGLMAAYVVHGKCLMQDVWRSKVDWDQEIPDEIYKRWCEWTRAIRQLDNVTLPRCYFPGYSLSSLENIELHVFVDASLVVDREQVRCALVSAKTKVAPLKPLSIPRLELQAAVIGSRLMKSVQDSHTLAIHRRVIWSDSSTVLSWIQSDQRKYRQFVAVRVGEILSQTTVNEWRKVPGRLNVADEATKWGEGPCFKKQSRWFAGPEFLYKDESEWPSNNLPEPDSTEELLPVIAHHRGSATPLIDYERFSKWERLQRAVAYVLRFCAKCSGKGKQKPTENEAHLSRSDLQTAEETIFRWVQLEAYPAEIASISKQQQMKPREAPRLEGSSPLYKLSPKIDTDGMLRMDGRIGAAHFVPYTTRFPIILPKTHYVTNLVLNWYHRRYGHSNNETVINEIRQKFHVSGLRNAVRTVAKKCMWCIVHKSTPDVPRMAPLPECRLAAYVRPFTFTGIDYCGPFLIRIGRSNVKRWVVLFVCQTVRAVHLEVASSLSTDSCILAVRRFIARRGAPQEIYSDQGTNFQGASKELKQQLLKMNNTLSETFTNKDTSWRFNPPLAPHMGGSWERLIRSVKIGLNTLSTSRNPSDETFYTMLVEVESMVNSRPLTYVPLSAENEEALTPNHFLLLTSSGVVQPAKQPVNAAIALRSNWGHVQQVLDRIWTRWIKEYLPTISRRTKWFKDTKPLEVGNLVIIVEDGIRNSWVRGKVLRTYPGKDGRVRAADVQTSGGVLQRPASKLAVLDIAGNGITEGSLQQYGSGNVGDSPHLI